MVKNGVGFDGCNKTSKDKKYLGGRLDLMAKNDVVFHPLLKQHLRG